jgi:hypothetical protein
MEKNNEQQELDLFSLLREIVNFSYGVLKKVAGFCGYLLRLTFKYFYLLFIFILAAVAYTYYTTHGPRMTYKGEVTLALNDGDANLYRGMISSLNRYLAERDPAGLDSALQIPKAEKWKIRFLSDQFTVDPQDTTALRAVITIGLGDPKAFPAIKNALVNFFERNDYLKSLNSVRIAFLKERERLVDIDIAEIDSLQKVEYFKKLNEVEVKQEQNLIFKTEKQMFYRYKLDLLKLKENINEELNAKSGVVSVISEFLPSSQPFFTWRDRIKKDVIRACFGFLLFVLLLDNRKPIIKYLREK